MKKSESKSKMLSKRLPEIILKQWKFNSEVQIRVDAIKRSKSAIMEKVTEQLLPYMPNFPYNPKDVRFIDSPIDLIVFNGLDDDCIKEIVFVEIKTGLIVTENLLKSLTPISYPLHRGRILRHGGINLNGCKNILAAATENRLTSVYTALLLRQDD